MTILGKEEPCEVCDSEDLGDKYTAWWLFCPQCSRKIREEEYGPIIPRQTTISEEP